MNDGTEGQAISERSGEVSNFHTFVTLSDVFAPFLQTFQTSLARHSLLPTTNNTVVVSF